MHMVEETSLQLQTSLERSARYLKGQWYCFTLSLIHCFDRKLRIKTTVYTLIEFISVNVTLYLCVLILLLCIYCIKAFLVD